MGEINISPEQQAALNTVDLDELDDLIGRAIRYERLGDVTRLPLGRCGPYVSGRLHAFEQALARHSQA